jgi:hypothetical protein
MAKPDQSKSKAPPKGVPKGLHDGYGPCGTVMTLADGSTYVCPYYCDKPLNSSGAHSDGNAEHTCSQYEHPF